MKGDKFFGGRKGKVDQSKSSWESWGKGNGLVRVAMRRSLRSWHLNKDLMEVMELSMWMPLEDSFSEREKNQCKGPEMRRCLEQQGGHCDWSSRV